MKKIIKLLSIFVILVASLLPANVPVEGASLPSAPGAAAQIQAPVALPFIGPMTPLPVVTEPHDCDGGSMYYRSASCSIDLVNNTHTCTGVTPVAFVAAPQNGKTVMRINLSTYEKVCFDVTYNAAPTGWTVNIGDSATNNGYAGDAGTQSNDAELHVTDQSFLVYANDYGGSKLLTNWANFVQSGSTVSFEVSNNRVDYTSTAGQAGTQTSPYLYALAGQADAEGLVNYDIYAAFNRVIAGGSRVGSGVSQVDITFCKPAS